MKIFFSLVTLCLFNYQVRAQVSFINSSSPTVGGAPSCVVAADVNGDGKLDLITANYGNAGGNTLSVLTNNGNGGFTLASSPIVGSGPRWVTTADVNGDGKIDLIAANYGDVGSGNTLSVLTNNGNGGFVLASSPVLSSAPFSVLAVDINGDGKMDLISANADNTVEVLTNDGNGGFVPSSSSNLGGNPRSLAVFTNVDGKIDLISANQYNNTLSFMTNNGNGGFGLAALLSGGNQPFEVTVADVNGDGKMDVVSANYGDNTLSVWTNNGSGGFALASSPMVGRQPFMVTAANINGDGNVDLISANLADNTLTVLTNNGSGGFGLGATLAVGSNPEAIVAGDVNGDGKLDLVSANGGDNTLTVLLNTTPPIPLRPPSGLVSWWRAEGNANDSIGNNNGSAVGNLAYANGEVGQAFVFDGSTSYITVPASASLNVGTNGGLTIECWIKPNYTEAAAMPIMEWDSSSTAGLHFWAEASHKLYANIIDTSGNIHPIYSTNDLLNTNNWQHVALTYDQASGNAMIYYNGTIETNLYIGSFTPQTSYPMNICRRTATITGLNDTYNGLIDELSLYNRALTSNEIAAIYNAGSAGKSVPPVPPSISFQPTNQVVISGQTVAFGVGAGGTAPLSYQWSFKGTNILNATNAVLTLNNVQLSNAGSYSVYVSNSYGSTNSASAVLTINNPVSQVPVITGFTPVSAVSGASMEIIGTNFSSNAVNNLVYFGAVRATVVFANATNLTVIVPVSATYAPITVTVNGLMAYSGQLFEPTFLGNGSGISSSSFGSRLDLAAGNGAYRVIIADIDGDGKPDLVVGNVSGNTISLYRNISTNGSLTAASFAPRVDIATAGGTYSPFGMAVADVDGDGKLDIIVSDYSSNLVSIYRDMSTPGNINSNSFAARVDFVTGSQPQGVEVRDIDGDGRPDILVANDGDGTVSIFRNTGGIGNLTTNSFASKIDVATGSGCSSIVIGDLDGDGKPDVVTANLGDNTLSLLRNTSSPGTISFASEVSLAVPNYPVQMAIGDLDGDGKLDLTVACYLSQTLSVFRNISAVGILNTNSFASRIDYALGGRGHTPAIADLDGDGKPDIAVVTELNSLLSVFRNVSTPGNFTNSSLAARVDFSTGYNAWNVAVGDLDGDGRPDIIFCNQYDSTISIYQNQTPFKGSPIITAQPMNQVVVAGQTVAFGVGAGGAAPLSYQWSFKGTNIFNATNATLTLNNVQLSNAGSYSVHISNPYGSTNSASAVLTVNPLPQTILTLGSTNGMSGSTLTVPILMNALGVENAFLASVAYDTNKLALQKVQLGQATASAYLQEIDSQTNNGSVGFAILLNSGAVIPAGLQEVAKIVFTALPVTSNVTTSLTFTDSPTTRQLYDNNLNALSAIYRGGVISLTPAEYAADVYPRFSGDHQVSVQDWLEVGRMVAGLDIVTNSDEKLRADCAPRNAPDGVLTVADWVQAGRYALGLDPLTLVTPPVKSNIEITPHGTPTSTRTLQLGTVSAARGQVVSVPVQLICNTNENAVGLTVIYNINQLTFISASLDSTLAGGRLNVNADLVAGTVGLAMAMSPGEKLAAGTNQLIMLQFLTSTNASGTVPIILGNSVVQLQVADITAVPLAANYVNGSVVLPLLPTLQTLKTGNNLQLTWPVLSGAFLMQSASSPAGPWTDTVQTIITNGSSATVTVQATNQQQYFRLIGQ